MAFVMPSNPLTDGYRTLDVIGIDTGITMLMAENARTGFVWEILQVKTTREAQSLAWPRQGFKASYGAATP